MCPGMAFDTFEQFASDTETHRKVPQGRLRNV